MARVSYFGLFALQHRGYLFRQEVPDQPDSPPYTWHADQSGRIALDRVKPTQPITEEAAVSGVA